MELQLMSYYSQHQQNGQTNSSLINSSKRKLAEEDTTTEFRSAKRAQLFNTVSITTEEAPASVYNSTNQFQLSATATANLGHSSSSDSIASTITTPSPPIEQDTMMIYDDLTDEEESLKTPCNTNYDYIPTDLGEDVENGGYTGQLERGWSEMFNEYNI